MPVGEVPLTSYFTRVPQEKKRKENPSPTNSAPAKRKRLNDDGEQVRAVKKKETKQVSLAFPKAKDTRKTAPVRTSGGSHHEARFPALESPVVLDPVPDKRPTPPSPASTTTIATGDLIDFTTDSPPLSSSQNTSPCSRNPLPQTPRIEQDDIRKVKSLALAHNNDASCRTEARDDDDPSSSFVPSSQTQDISSPNPLNSSLPSLPEHSESRTLAPPSPFDASQWDDSIPSSQSQYILPIQSSPGHEGEISDIDFVPSSQSQYITPTPTAIQRDEDGFVVPSSQSQWLPPFHSYGEVEEDMAADDEVPSSQSQFELELKPASFCHRRASVGNPPTSAVPSLEIPLPPGLDIDITDIFEDPPVDAAPVVDEDDSPTESDDDAPIVPLRKVEPVHFPSPEQGGSSLQSGFTGSTLDDGAVSSGSSSGSLPAAVKDFYDMVGSGAGSYPDSFPESLKWIDQDTQDQD